MRFREKSCSFSFAIRCCLSFCRCLHPWPSRYLHLGARGGRWLRIMDQRNVHCPCAANASGRRPQVSQTHAAAHSSHAAARSSRRVACRLCSHRRRRLQQRLPHPRAAHQPRFRQRLLHRRAAAAGAEFVRWRCSSRVTRRCVGQVTGRDRVVQPRAAHDFRDRHRAQPPRARRAFPFGAPRIGIQFE